MAQIVENYILICDNYTCHKKIEANTWYRLKYNDKHDFCSKECAEEYRNSGNPVVVFSPLDEQYRIMENTD